ncbi:MAG: ABC-2 type transport system ATP-binding protein [Gammaproteobacteria bacterium]|jgi:ABC-2 type transport system ATP-binding protein
MIDVRHLTFEYPGHRALDDVSFTIERNSVTALVGPNGSGKTTLMRCLCGLEQPLSGNIVVDGIDVVDQPRQSHERMGYLSDFFGLYNELSVRQCMRHAAEANRASGDLTAAIKSTAENLRLSDRLDQPVGELSRGLRQRVAIAQAIIHEPKVLILDEPASGLDPEARHDLAELFKLLRTTGMTLLVSSHILAELEAYASEMLIIRDGRIVDQQLLTTPTASIRRLLIEVIGPTNKAVEIIEKHPEVRIVDATDNQIICELAGDHAAQHELLMQLVSRGAKVVNFSTRDVDLQHSYLNTIRSALNT